MGLNCRSCAKPLPDPFLDLGVHPLANNLCTSMDPHEDFRAPLHLVECPSCSLVQIDVAVHAGRMFSEYLYAPGTSQTFVKHFNDLAGAVTAHMPSQVADGTVVDIGSNDGTLLTAFKALGWRRVIGVESAANQCRRSNDRGIPTIHGFWPGSETIDQLGRGRVDVVTATNVFAHVADPVAFARAVGDILSIDGSFVIECPSLAVMYRDGTFDLCYHEHQSYFSVQAIRRVINRAGLVIYKVDSSPIHGGSLRVWACRPGRHVLLRDRKTVDEAIEAEIGFHGSCSTNARDRFAINAVHTATAFRNAVRSQRGIVAGYGAPAKAVTLIECAGLGMTDLAYIVDDNEMRQGKYLPGSHIPVVPSSALRDNRPAAVVIFPWNIVEDILPRLPTGIRVIVPMPKIRVIET